VKEEEGEGGAQQPVRVGSKRTAACVATFRIKDQASVLKQQVPGTKRRKQQPAAAAGAAAGAAGEGSRAAAVRSLECDLDAAGDV
jgi:hypothetical protein